MVAATDKPGRPTSGPVENVRDRVSGTFDRVGETFGDVRGSVTGVVQTISTTVSTTVERKIKPHLRGWIHAGTFPFALAASITLIVLAPGAAAKWSVAVFGLTAALLFGTSAVYHRGTWSPKVEGILRRADHSNIFLIIAGTYTPLAVTLLDQRTATILLWIVWSGALAGLIGRIVWLHAPRWVYTPIYVALGWVAVGYMRPFWEAGGPAVVWLIISGGVAYTLGAIVYATKKPDPSPRWFGFHEIFHVLTVLGFASHVVAIYFAVLS
ncbi:PAQR family membrane homeostasis protein TrhA [Myceligenerans pegani]|uniref:PAQR family membrane homeostasis protein TrhA n=1 Tax=Myceligenerans pegani TaxID=2776917 RepID=UPI0038CC1A52